MVLKLLDLLEINPWLQELPPEHVVRTDPFHGLGPWLQATEPTTSRGFLKN